MLTRLARLAQVSPSLASIEPLTYLATDGHTYHYFAFQLHGCPLTFQTETKPSPRGAYQCATLSIAYTDANAALPRTGTAPGHVNTTDAPQHFVLAQTVPASPGCLVGPFENEESMWGYVKANRYSIPRTVAPGKTLTVASARASAYN
jgi:hypothetical protein